MEANTVDTRVVAESRFGFWFLGTRTWEERVVNVALQDLLRLMEESGRRFPVILDAGCGQGKAFRFLQEQFAPERLVGLDVDTEGLECARREASRRQLNVELIEGNCAAIALPDASVDMVFCHQTFHHLVDQEHALQEFYRVLKPGGLLLFAESTREYICSWVIRLLFRHPMHVQRSAEEYLAMIRAAGFRFEAKNVSYPYLWWSRARDFGLLERLHIKSPPPPGQRAETLVNVVACK